MGRATGVLTNGKYLSSFQESSRIAPLNQSLKDYQVQLKKGTIRTAYQGIMQFMQDLKSTLKNKYPDYCVSQLYIGAMDMTYFAFTPLSLRDQQLKIAIVFLHEELCFEAWLSGNNRDIQARYWNHIRAIGWEKYRLSSNPRTSDSILECPLAVNPDFDNLPTLTERIEGEILDFSREIDTLLKSYSINQ